MQLSQQQTLCVIESCVRAKCIYKLCVAGCMHQENSERIMIIIVFAFNRTENSILVNSAINFKYCTNHINAKHTTQYTYNLYIALYT